MISIIGSPHNLHNYDELGVAYVHRPFLPNEDERAYLAAFYRELHDLLQTGTKVLVHGEEVGDRIVGLVGVTSAGPAWCATGHRPSSSNASPVASSIRSGGA